MDYSVLLSSQLKQHLKSLRKSRKMTQAELAQRLGVVQSRVADIEANPGTVSVEQLLQILAILDAQLVVRDGGGTAAVTGTRGATPAPPASSSDSGPQGQW